MNALSRPALYGVALAALLVVVAVIVVAWRSGLSAGNGQLPYRAYGTTTDTGGSSAYAPTVEGSLSAGTSR